MPYIKSEDRTKFMETFWKLREVRFDTPGDLNYFITKVVHFYTEQHGGNYQSYNDVLGALEGVKLELYRRKVASYEDSKIETNGDV